MLFQGLAFRLAGSREWPVYYAVNRVDLSCRGKRATRAGNLRHLGPFLQILLANRGERPVVCALLRHIEALDPTNGQVIERHSPGGAYPRQLSLTGDFIRDPTRSAAIDAILAPNSG